MRLLWAEIRDFRNHRHTRVEPPDGLAVAVGGNGEGKTNLLEALFYLMTLSSPRTASDLPLVRRGLAAGYLRGEVEGPQGRALVEIEVRASGANRVQVNGSSVRRRAEVRRLVRAVLFSPGDLSVVQGDPQERRSFLDDAVAGIWPQREGLARAYDKTLRQRNRLLKDWEGGGVPPGLDVWDGELVRTGSALTRARAEAAERLAPPVTEEFAALAGYGLLLRYEAAATGEEARPGETLEDAFHRRLSERRPDELVRRSSLVGPHRDELDLAVRDMTARGFASHGEAWAAALSLRLGLATAIADEAGGDRPVLLLDDPFPGLDPDRQRRLAGRVRGRGQTVLSVADALHVPDGAAAVWDVSDGAVRAQGAG